MNKQQERIWYENIIELGFTEEETNDNVYLRQYGYDYVIITKKLTKRIYIEWAKETGHCEIVRIDKGFNILAKRPIYNLAHLKDIVKFFTDIKLDK